jgi:DNA (cytosine-5)-methyltransferase 1
MNQAQMEAKTCSLSDFVTQFLDGFCGAGGASLGIERAGCGVAVAINHDDRAIWAHAANHPSTLHLNTDIRLVDLRQLAMDLLARGIFRISIWWSAECTHFSNAKGGASRDADSRMLSEELIRYVRELEKYGLQVDWIFVENVREFFSWCPLLPKWKSGKRIKADEKRYTRLQIEMFDAVALGDKDLRSRLAQELDEIYVRFQQSGSYDSDKEGKITMLPDPSTKGLLYLRWHEAIERIGYRYQWRMMNAADYGAYQSRERYFGVYLRRDIADQLEAIGCNPIKFPNPTHAKVPKQGTLFKAGLEPWKPCRDILELDDRGESIFYGRRIKRGKRKGQPMTRLVMPTLDRVKYGILRSKDWGDSIMVDRSNTNAHPTGLDGPLPTVRASYENGVVHVSTVDNCTFGSDEVPVDGPMPTVMAKRDKYLMQAFLVPSNFSNAPYAINGPLTTLVASRKHQYLCTPFIAQTFTNGGKPNQVSSCGHPLWALTTNPKGCLVSPFMVQQYGQSKANGVDEPIGALTVNPKHSVIFPFLLKYYGTGENVTSISNPCGTVTTKDRIGVAQCQFLNYYYGGGKGNSDARSSSTGNPINTVGTTHLPSLINCNFITYNYGGHNSAQHVTPTTAPVNTVGTGFTPTCIVAQLMPEIGDEIILEHAPDFYQTKRGNWISGHWGKARAINGYWVSWNIIDIHYRMLKVSELKLAQGFPKDYILDPHSETVAKKHIGNAVHVDCARSLVEINCGPESDYSRLMQKQMKMSDQSA